MLYRGQKLIIAVKARTAAIISNTVAIVPLIKSRKYRTTIAAAHLGKFGTDATL